jgi:hypothetical protein
MIEVEKSYQEKLAMLKLAARAVGYGWEDIPEREDNEILALWVVSPKMRTGWNPLEKSTDAFALSCELKIDISHDGNSVVAERGSYKTTVNYEKQEDVLKATCEAITKTAALLATKDVTININEKNMMVSFEHIPLGGRFKYPEDDRVWTVLEKYREKQGDLLSGVIAEWQPNMMTFGKWSGQSICSHLADDPDCPEMVIAVD